MSKDKSPTVRQINSNWINYDNNQFESETFHKWGHRQTEDGEMMKEGEIEKVIVFPNQDVHNRCDEEIALASPKNFESNNPHL